MKHDETGVRRTSNPPLKPRSYERGFLFTMILNGYLVCNVIDKHPDTARHGV